MTVPEIPVGGDDASDSELSLWIHTPLLESSKMSELLGCRVLLKMEMFQPSGSFKSRGIGHLCRTSLEDMLKKKKMMMTGVEDVMFYCPSGGNAGLAALIAARKLSAQATIILPSTAPAATLTKIAELGGTAVVHGTNWKEADGHARSLVGNDPMGIYIPPFDHPAIWAGNATLVDELVTDLHGATPDVVIASVGGGGLLCGILHGLEQHDTSQSTSLVAVETSGTAKLAKSMDADEIVELEEVSGLATSLGSTKVCKGLWNSVKRWEKPSSGAIKSWVCTDAQAARACVRFADEERCVVEAACGAALAAVYEPGVLRGLLAASSRPLTRESTVVIVVCGGNNANIEVLENYRKTYC